MYVYVGNLSLYIYIYMYNYTHAYTYMYTYMMPPRDNASVQEAKAPETAMC